MVKALNKTVFPFFLLLSTISLFAQDGAKQGKANDIRTIIVFFDGLRPDYITPEGMPNLYAFRQQNAYGKQHHSVFPTVTRVNASSYSTGSYPGTHGLLGNTVYFPEVDTKKGLNTGDASELNKIVQATNGHLLTTISLGEILQSVGAHMMVFSSGSTGQAMMQNHTVSGGAIINPTMILPESFKEKVISDIGAIPPAGKPNTQRHKWITDALLYYGLAADGPTVSAIWFSDPDGSAHSDGIGSPAAVQSIKDVDAQFGRIINALKEKGLTDKFNIMVSTDLGFITDVGKDDVANFLIKEGIKKDKESEDVVIAGGAIYVKDHDEQTIRRIVSKLQMQDWIGAIFTKGKKAGDMKGWIDGTLSFESIHWNHSNRIADILVDENWDDRKNAAGYAGSSFSRGVAGHGGLSPYEVHIPLILAGPGIKKAFESDLPTSNVDIVPTLLYLHNIPVPVSMDGRVIYEMMAKQPKSVPAAKKETITTTATTDSGTYVLQLERTITGKYAYVNYATVKRTK
jgi:predicted AlkP superfamily pyrophosphatase or phosphodiesterase